MDVLIGWLVLSVLTTVLSYQLSFDDRIDSVMRHASRFHRWVMLVLLMATFHLTCVLPAIALGVR